MPHTDDADLGDQERSVADDLDDALTALAEAQPAYEEAHSYHQGEEPEKFLSPTIQKLLTGSSRDFRINLAGRVVNAVLDRLEIGAITAELNEPAADLPIEEDDAPAEEDEDDGEAAPGPEEPNEPTRVLNRIWHDNQLDIEAPELHEKQISLGDAYLFVWPITDEASTTTGVEMYYNSPMSVRVLYERENPRKKRLAIKKWTVGTGKDAKVRVNLYYPGEPGHIHKLITKARKRGDKAADFEAFVDEHTDDNGVMAFPWGWDELPFFHFRTVRPYGRPEHKQAYGAQDAATKLITNMMSAVDFAAFPQRVALLEPGAATDDDTDWDEDDTAAPEDLQSQMIAGPGRVWLLRYIKEVKEFAAADMDQFLKPLNWIVGAMAAVTGTPISQFQQVLGGANTRVSGESQRQDKEPLVKKVNARQLSTGASWRDALQFALRLMGFEATTTVTVHWKPPLIISTKEEWEAVQQQQDAGVPVRQTLLEAGYTEAEVTSWGYTEDNPDGPGIDLSQFPSPPPVPGAPPPGGPGQPPQAVEPQAAA